MAIYNGTNGNNTYTGTTDPDFIYGFGGNDTLNGAAGNDTIEGGDGNDTLDGGADDDMLYGGLGRDVVRGGTGDDNIYFTSASDVVAGETYDGGDGADTLVTQSESRIDFSTSTLTGIERLDDRGSSFVMMTAAQIDALTYLVVRDLEVATAGTVDLTGAILDNNTIFYLAAGGNRLVLTGTADSFGGNFGYTVNGGAGDDTVLSSAGNDTLNGNGGNDTLDGAAGGDTVRGGDEVDSITGGTGNDILYGDAGNDTIDGGADNDELYGGLGRDVVRGGTGDDNIYFTSASDIVAGETYDGGDGADTLVTQSESGIDFSTSTLTGIERLDGAFVMMTAAQIDALTYLVVSDLEVATAGTVDLTGAILDNNTIFYLAAGGNRLVLTGTADSFGGNFGYTVNGGVGDDTVLSSAGNDTLNGNGGNDTLDGAAGGDTVRGGDEVDSITGGTGNDILYGDAGNDTIDGGADNDELYGGLGRDVVRGGTGDDNIYFTSASDVVAGETYDGGDGADTLVTQSESRIDFSTSTLTGIERLDDRGSSFVMMTAAQIDALTYLVVSDLEVATAGTVDLTGAILDNNTIFYLAAGGNRLVLTGTADSFGGNFGYTVNGGAGDDTVLSSAGNDTLNGNGGNDTLDGAAGGDTVRGGDEVDSITGGTGNDILYGDAGNDTIDGGADNDELYGGLGRDVVRGGTGDDNIYFTSASDVVAGETYDGGDGADTLVTQSEPRIDFSTSTLTGIERLDDRGSAFVVMTAAQIDALTYLQVRDLEVATAGTVDLTGAMLDNDTIFYLAAGGNRLVLTGTVDINGDSFGYTVNGGAGDDTVLSSAGNDTLNGNGGNDTLDGAAGADTLDGGSGNDTASYGTATAAVTVNLAIQDGRQQNTLGAGNDTLTGFENLTGSRFADTLTGDGNANIIEGGAGNDTLDGGAGKDQASYAGAGAAVTVSLAIRGAQATGGAGNDKLAGFEGLIGSASGDTLTGDTAANTLSGGLGDDVLRGGAGADRLIGGGGAADVAVYTGNFADYDIVAVAGGYTVTDRRSGKPDGVDTLSEVEKVRFANGGEVAIGAAVNVGPVAVDDLGSREITEAGGRGPGVSTTAGNLLDNDIDPNLQVPELGETLTVVAAQVGGTAGAFSDIPPGGSFLNGTYGRLTILRDGSYTYQLDNALPATEALQTGQVVQEVFGYRIVDAHGAASVATLTVTINGDNETIAEANPDKLLVTLGVASALSPGVLLANDMGPPGETLTITAISSAVNCTVSLAGGVLSVTASAATGSFDYTITTESGATRTGHVDFDAATIRIPDNIVAAAADVSAADLVGNRNADRFTGSNGEDRLVGVAGDDVLDGRGGADQLIGGTGNDSYVVDHAGDRAVEDANAGIDTVSTTLAAHTLGANLENLTFAGTGGFAGTGNALANGLTGGAGNDGLFGGDGNDVLVGGRGNDMLDGGVGTADTASYAGAARGVTADLRIAAAQATGMGNDTLTGIENLTGSTFDDLLFGSDGINALNGGGGRDVLIGNGGADRIEGGAGADVLHGGAGGDSFVFAVLSDSSAAQSDRVADFSRVQGDVIDLSLIDADAAAAGDQAFTFIGSTAFTGAGGSAYEVRVVMLDDDSFLVEADANRDGVADLSFMVTTDAALQQSDFRL